jgi:hypothetical protein
MAVVHQSEEKAAALPHPEIVQAVLSEFQDVFAEPNYLPPHREYDHTIPLMSGVVPMNAKS